MLNRAHSLEQLSATAEWAALGSLPESEAVQLADLINEAPVPCYRQARKGISLASALLAENRACAGLGEQLRLARNALGSLDDPKEALAVLRVERRLRPRTEGRHARGPVDAPVVVVEWGDFECPYCVRVNRWSVDS